jgi:CheY-like chemotaxis protein
MEAVEIYEQHQERIDLVVLDLTMPRLSGRDAFHLLVEINPQIKVLFASGYSAEHLTEVHSHQLVGFVSKPYRPEELLQMVRAALDRDEANLHADSLGEPASANGVTMLRIAPN